MSQIVVLAIVAAPVLAGLAVHIYRDVRGGARNRRGCCYSCGKLEEGMELVHHHKGGTYRYCDACRERHESAKRWLVLFTLAAFVGFLAVDGLTRVGMNLWASVILVALAMVVVALLVRARIAPIKDQE